MCYARTKTAVTVIPLKKLFIMEGMVSTKVYHFGTVIVAP